MTKTALFSLHDLIDAELFARQLISCGWEIIATRETVDALARAGVAVADIDSLTGNTSEYPFPATLHPRIEQLLTANEGPRIDLVYVIPYPLGSGNDVGGNTLLALAAKGCRIPVMSRDDMRAVVDELAAQGDLSSPTRAALTDKANAMIAHHYLELLSPDGAWDGVVGRASYELLNGENPYQVPAHLFGAADTDPLALHKLECVSGEPPCFTNLADSDCLLQTLCLTADAFRKARGRVPFITITSKHGSACGFAVSWDSPAVAASGALFGNPEAVWGGEFIANFPIDEELADLLFKSSERERRLGDPHWMLDVLMAPAFHKAAVETLGRRSHRKLLQNAALAEPVLSEQRWARRAVRGGFLRQPPNHYVLDLNRAVPDGRNLSEEERDSLVIAWAVAWSSAHGGNEIALAKARSLLSAGGGPSTVTAAQAVVARARAIGHECAGSVFAANAFFPFTDAPKVLADAGVVAGVVPAGGKREADVRELFHSRGLSVVYLGEQYRGFSRH